MFRIGEFSQIARVIIDTLRHYDALGLLKPAQVDPFTGYRYYSARQLMTLNRILALEESARILRKQLTNDRLHRVLKAQLVRCRKRHPICDEGVARSDIFTTPYICIIRE
jgi:DNA-binding transcriptional MerR regulator